jgi:hypothetical protein
MFWAAIVFSELALTGARLLWATVCAPSGLSMAVPPARLWAASLGPTWLVGQACAELAAGHQPGQCELPALWEVELHVEHRCAKGQFFLHVKLLSFALKHIGALPLARETGGVGGVGALELEVVVEGIGAACFCLLFPRPWLCGGPFRLDLSAWVCFACLWPFVAAAWGWERMSFSHCTEE